MFLFNSFVCIIFFFTVIQNAINISKRDCNDFLPPEFYYMVRNKSYITALTPISAAALHFTYDDFCVGSLISHYYVLTVASCVQYMDSVTVILGAYHLNEPNPLDQVVLTSKVMKIHDNFISGDYLLNDIALIKLPHSVVFNNFIQPVRLAPANMNLDAYAGSFADLINYEKNENEPTHLVYRPLEIITNKDCHYKPYRSLKVKTLMCTRDAVDFSGCEEDEGSQLIINNTLIGMMSYAFFMCDFRRPMLYTRISAFRKWIAENSDVPYDY